MSLGVGTFGASISNAPISYRSTGGGAQSGTASSHKVLKEGNDTQLPTAKYWLTYHNQDHPSEVAPKKIRKWSRYWNSLNKRQKAAMRDYWRENPPATQGDQIWVKEGRNYYGPLVDYSQIAE